MEKIYTAKDIGVMNWYYIQVFIDRQDELDFTSCYTVCFAHNKESCLKRVNQWLDEKGVNKEGKRDINIYHKNYKIESRKMVEAGNYIVA